MLRWSVGRRTVGRVSTRLLTKTGKRVETRSTEKPANHGINPRGLRRVSNGQELLYRDNALVKCILPSIEPDRVGTVAPADQLAARPIRRGPRSRTGSLDAGGRSAWPRKTHRERRQPSASFPGSGTWFQAPRPAHYHLMSARCSCPTWCSKPRNKQIDVQKRDLAYLDLREWARDLKAGVLQQLLKRHVFRCGLT